MTYMFGVAMNTTARDDKAGETSSDRAPIAPHSRATESGFTRVCRNICDAFALVVILGLFVVPIGILCWIGWALF